MAVKKETKKVLMIFIEPAPYIMVLLDALFDGWGEGKLEVVFLKKNLTQEWDVALPEGCKLLKSKREAFRFLCSKILRRHYRLIHVAGWSNPVCLVSILLSPLIRVPVVVESDTQMNLDLPLWKRTVKRCLYSVLFKFPTLFLPGGTRQAYYFRQYSVPSNKMIIAQMTVDVRGIQQYVETLSAADQLQIRRQYGTQNKEIVFLFVGRLLALKGIKELILAFAALNDTQAKLWIVGDGELNQYVLNAVVQEKNIVYHGKVTGHALLRLYNAADVFVLPSHADQWGFVVNEGMAAGKPVIVSDAVGCSDDLVMQAKTGLIIKPKCVEALSSAMRFMLEYPSKRIDMGKSASDHIAGWTIENETQNIIKAWKKALAMN
jgi:glycosyltransferase involved in cell wall biosynthesis